MAYGNNYGGMPQPANNLWVGNNYSSGYSQMSRECPDHTCGTISNLR